MIQVPELQHLIQVLELLPISRWAIATVHLRYNLKYKTVSHKTSKENTLNVRTSIQ